jgi:hypothetical protein
VAMQTGSKALRSSGPQSRVHQLQGSGRDAGISKSNSKRWARNTRIPHYDAVISILGTHENINNWRHRFGRWHDPFMRPARPVELREHDCSFGALHRMGA